MALAACYAPKLKPGSPCDDDHPCPRSLVCTQGTCEETATEIDAGTDAPPPDGCVPTGFDICGDGIDQDCSGADSVCAANDKPAGAVDVTAGGMFTADLLFAHDDLASKGCGGDGGNDVFYKITLAAPQVYYLDTFTSGFDTSLRVFTGKDCAAVTSAMFPQMCNDDACGTGESQLALLLPAGTSCLVVDKNFNGGQDPGKGTFQLHVVPGGRTGMPLPTGVASQKGDTCTGTNMSEPPALNDCVADQKAKDLAYFFTTCPGQTAHIDASTCVDVANTHYDTMVYLRAADGKNLACVDDTGTCTARPDRDDGQPDGSILTNVPVKGPGLFWLVVDGYGGACGAYQLDTNLR
jgi:hypothetical protein